MEQEEQFLEIIKLLMLNLEMDRFMGDTGEYGLIHIKKEIVLMEDQKEK